MATQNMFRILVTGRMTTAEHGPNIVQWTNGGHRVAKLFDIRVVSVRLGPECIICLTGPALSQHVWQSRPSKPSEPLFPSHGGYQAILRHRSDSK